MIRRGTLLWLLAPALLATQVSAGGLGRLPIDWVVPLAVLIGLFAPRERASLWAVLLGLARDLLGGGPFGFWTLAVLLGVRVLAALRFSVPRERAATQAALGLVFGVAAGLALAAVRDLRGGAVSWPACWGRAFALAASAALLTPALGLAVARWGPPARGFRP